MQKNKIIAGVLTLIIGIGIFLIGFIDNNYNYSVDEVYQVYLDGEKIGVIKDENELYSLINEEQKSIRDEYNVSQVYPPKGFSISKYVTYDTQLSTAADIYNLIKEEKDFTVKGYTITVMSEENEDEDAKVLFRINVLDKSIFEEAINKVIKSFISEEQYNDYINDKQLEIDETGEKILNIYFQENISIKETYISTQEKIFDDVDELSKYLLFGENNQEKKYKVKSGDTIESIAYDNELNVSEFLVANNEYKSENDLLAIGDEVIISLIDPMLTLVYDKYTVEDVTEKYSTITKYDYSKPTSYRLVQTKGVNGIRRVASTVQVINGDVSQGSVIDQANTYVIREKVDQVIVKGAKNSGIYVDDGTEWAWPTNRPCIITSRFGTRYLFDRTSHDGLDISGTGYGSPIYAIQDGVVMSARYGGWAGNSSGLNIIIQHPNGLWSLYAHLSAINVSVGDQVTRAQRIGSMGNSGLVTGTHLHIGIFTGKPYNGGRAINPELILNY